MNVTKEIVKDLLPLYVSGEASADTRALVEAYLREDPELARLTEAMRADDAAPLPPQSIPERSGRAALERTKSLLRRRSWLLAFALMFTGLPLSFAVDGSGLKFVLLRDAPVVAWTSLGVAAVLWIAFAVTRMRMKVTGL